LATAQLRNQYTTFIKNLSEHLDNTYDDIELTVDMYAGAATKNMLWEVEEIAPLVDYIIVMAYDFHRSSSPTAGPVAPLFEKEASWSESINGYLRDFSRKVPTNKLLLGIPFYGYEWQTTSTDPGSFTLPRTGATASYRRVKELISQKEALNLTEHWDENALAPYLSYVKDGENYLVYFENAASVAYKLEYVNQLNLAGIAIWSLGYEGESRDLWNVIDLELAIQN
jgi:spore germination protein YaaH